MNKKLKLLTLFSAIATTAIEPLSQLSETTNTKNQNLNIKTRNSKITNQNKRGYESVYDEDNISDINTNPFIGYVPSNFDDKSNKTYENGTFTPIHNESYLIVPYWLAVTKKPHFNSFATYTIDPFSKQLSVVNKKINLGYNVDNKVILYPQLIGNDLVTFFRTASDANPYGLGEWNVGVTNVMNGEYVTYSLKNAIGEETVNNRNIYIMLDNSNPSTINYYLAQYKYTDKKGQIIISKLNRFDPRNQLYNLEKVNDLEINNGNSPHPKIFDVTFGEGYAVPKYSYQNNVDIDNQLLGWNNLFIKNDPKEITINHQPYENIRGYWLFKTKSGLIFVNLGNNDEGQVSLEIGLLDSENNAGPSNIYSFNSSDPNFDFYKGEAITFSFFKGNDETYYLFPKGINNNNPNLNSISSSSFYFSFSIGSGLVNDFNAYNYNGSSNLFATSNIFSNSRINYVTSSGTDIISSSFEKTSELITNKHYRTSISSLTEQFITFLTENLFFVDLNVFYATTATVQQKQAIEKVALWIGKDKDYSFQPMTIDNIKTAALNNFSLDVSQMEFDEVTVNFLDAQKTSIQTLLKATFDKWTITIEGILEGKTHQWGWYNENQLSYMFPAYVLDPLTGLTYDNTDTDLSNPRIGLQKLIDKFRINLEGNKPIKFDSLINDYLNLESGSDIELTFFEYQSYGKNQLEWYRQRIAQEFATFYYGFPDINLSNNKFWNYFMEDSTHDIFLSIDDMITKWINVFSNSSFDSGTVLNFFLNTKIWNNLTIDKIAGKNATLLQFPFEYTLELQSFKDININTFNSVVDNFYESFLITQYMGYEDNNLLDKLDVSSYFSSPLNGLPEVISKLDFINTFSSAKVNVYTYFSKFYNWTSNVNQYSFSRNNRFSDWASNQQGMLYEDIKRIIDTIYSGYWGYGNLSIPSSLLDIFFASDQKTALDSNEVKNNIMQSFTQKKYQIYAYLNTGKIKNDLNYFLIVQLNAAKNDLAIILEILKKYYYGYEYDFSGAEQFVGAKNLSLFFIRNGDITNGIVDTYEELFNIFRINVVGSDLVKNNGKDYTEVSQYFKTLYETISGKNNPTGGLLNYQNWSEAELENDINNIANIYFNDYFGFATGNDAILLNQWFGVINGSFLTLEQLKTNLYNHFFSLSQVEYKSAMKDLIKILGIDFKTDDSIFGRDLKNAIEEINFINQLWRDNYYGVEGYARDWFQYTYSSVEHNWLDMSIRSDFTTIHGVSTLKTKLLKDFLIFYKTDSQILTAFKSYQNSELLKLLQPIIDFYNSNYMGYDISQNYLLETMDDVMSTGWNFNSVVGKISSIITKSKDTKVWELQFVKIAYDSNTKQTSFYNEQMNLLIKDINDNFIGKFIKNNYFGYNFGVGIPSNVQTILSWQSSNEIDAIWDTTTWNNGNWANTLASTYKIFNDINSNHDNNLQRGRTFKSILDSYMNPTGGGGLEFLNYQMSELTSEVATLITNYRINYKGYMSASVMNTSYLPGMIPMNNGHLNWNLSDTITSLINDNNNFQDTNRLLNGKWLHNNALALLNIKITSGENNLKSLEEDAFDADIIKIISEYKKYFRGFMNNVNGNKLTFKTLGGERALENGVFISTSTDVSSEIFNSNALKTYAKSLRNVINNNTMWEANVIAEYEKNKVSFKDEQNRIFYNYLELLDENYGALTNGYIATFDGEPLKYSNLPGQKIGEGGVEMDINLAINFFDNQTYNQMTNPNHLASYRLSYDAWKKFDNNKQNYANEQSKILSQDVPVTHQGFLRQNDIFNLLSDEETLPTWNTNTNYRGNYSDLKLSQQDLELFLNQQKNKNSLADLNNISSNWYSSFEGDENDDWNNTSLKHNFMFFGQYGMMLEVFYDPTSPTDLPIAIVNLNDGKYIMEGLPDSIVLSPTSQDGDIKYGTTLVITKDKKQVTYKMLPSSTNSPYDQLLFTVADITWGVPSYELAQKITITQNFDNSSFTENSISVITYDEKSFSYLFESPNVRQSFLLQDSSAKINTIKNVDIMHHVIRTYRDAFIQIGVNRSVNSGLQSRSNISISNSNLTNKIISLDEIIKQLPAPAFEEGFVLPTWLLAIIISLSVVTVLGIPLVILLIRKKRLSNRSRKFQQ